MVLSVPEKYRSAIIGVAAGLTVGVGGAANALGAAEWVNVTLGLKSRLEIQSEKLGKRMLAHPRMKELVKGKSPKEVHELAASLSKSGIQYLPEAQLQRWVALQRQLASNSPEFCAARWKGGMQPTTFNAALGTLTEIQQTEWLEMTTQATLAALEGGRPPAVAPDALPRGFETVFGGLPRGERERAQTDASRQELSDARACELLQLVLGGVDDLPDGLRVDFARALSQL
jgi:hypothetical protein